MPNFSPTRPGSVWSLLTTLGSAEMADIDAKLVKAINGAEGGTYAPTDAGGLAIGGKGLHLGTTTGGFYHSIAGTGELRWESGTTLKGVLGATLNWLGSATFGPPPTFSNGFTSSGTSQCNGGLEVTSAVASNINVGVGGTITLVGSNPTYSTMTVGTYGKIDMVGTGILQAGSTCYWYTSGEIVCEGDITFDPSTGKVLYLGSANADMRLEGPLKCNGTKGTVTYRTTTHTPSGSPVTIACNDYDTYRINAPSGGSTTVYTLSAGHTTGQRIVVAYYNLGALTASLGHTITVASTLNPNGPHIIGTNTGEWRSVTYEWDGSNWQAIAGVHWLQQTRYFSSGYCFVVAHPYSGPGCDWTQTQKLGWALSVPQLPSDSTALFALQSGGMTGSAAPPEPAVADPAAPAAPAPPPAPPAPQAHAP